jgi:hypothetical protein
MLSLSANSLWRELNVSKLQALYLYEYLVDGAVQVILYFMCTSLNDDHALLYAAVNLVLFYFHR